MDHVLLSESFDEERHMVAPPPLSRTIDRALIEGQRLNDMISQARKQMRLLQLCIEIEKRKKRTETARSEEQNKENLVKTKWFEKVKVGKSKNIQTKQTPKVARMQQIATFMNSIGRSFKEMFRSKKDKTNATV